MTTMEVDPSHDPNRTLNQASFGQSGFVLTPWESVKGPVDFTLARRLVLVLPSVFKCIVSPEGKQEAFLGRLVLVRP